MVPKGFSFTLRGRKWEVLQVPKKHPEMPKATLGVCLAHKGQIFIREGLGPQILKNTLWHELTHSVLEVLRGEKIAEEVACNLMADAMLELLPQMKRWPTWAR